MVPDKWQHHFETNRSELQGKGIEYTKHRGDDLLGDIELQTFTPEMRKPGCTFQGELLYCIGWRTVEHRDTHH